VVAGCDGNLELCDMTSEPPEVQVVHRALRKEN
jgi:hypothetical protein